MSSDRGGDRDRYLELLDQEIERRRQAALVVDGGNMKRQLLDKLAQIGRRLRAAPGYVESSPEERRAGLRAVKSWLRERGYMTAGGR